MRRIIAIAGRIILSVVLIIFGAALGGAIGYAACPNNPIAGMVSGAVIVGLGVLYICLAGPNDLR